MEQTQHTPANKPVAEHKAGPVKGTAWQNEGQFGPYFNVSLFRFYKDRDGNWKQTKSFRPKDMPQLAAVASELGQQFAAMA